MNLSFLPCYRIQKILPIRVRSFHLRKTRNWNPFHLTLSIFDKNSEGKFHSNSFENSIELIILTDCFYVNDKQKGGRNQNEQCSSNKCKNIYFHNLIGFLLRNNSGFNPIEMINLSPVNSMNELPLDDLESDQYYE